MRAGRPSDAGGMEHGRIQTALDAWFEAGATKAQGEIENVGRGGLFVGTAAIPEEGELVTIEFSAPDGERIRVTGIVWWTTQDRLANGQAPGFGVRLVDENASFEGLLDQLSG